VNPEDRSGLQRKVDTDIFVIFVTRLFGGYMAQHKGADHHKQAAQHHKHAATHHEEAAKHHEAGNHEKGALHAHAAHGHHLNAEHHLHEAAKQHATEHGGGKK